MQPPYGTKYFRSVRGVVSICSQYWQDVYNAIWADALIQIFQSMNQTLNNISLVDSQKSVDTLLELFLFVSKWTPIFLTCWLEKINIFKLISFVYIRIQIVFVPIENKRKQFEQGFRLVSMFMLSFFMFYSNSHILEFISKQKEPIRTNYQWELSYVFRKDNSTFCVPHQGGPIYIL